jgi:anti-sigma factor RsiW
MCTNPVIGDRLSAYISNPLDDATAEEVEDHLLECRHCRKFFLTMLRIRGEARRTKDAPDGDNGRAPSDEKLVRFPDFKKEWT